MGIVSCFLPAWDVFKLLKSSLLHRLVVVFVCGLCVSCGFLLEPSYDFSGEQVFEQPLLHIDGVQPSFVWPVKDVEVSSFYGVRSDPRTFRKRFHFGVDLQLSIGDDVVAAETGRVVWCGERGDYGLQLLIEHSGGFVSSYSHLLHIHVQPGDWVAAGSVVAWAGRSGRSTGPHVHWEVLKNGKRVNPLRLLADSGSFHAPSPPVATP